MSNGGKDAVAQRVRQLALFLDRAQHGLAAVFEFAEVSQLLFNGPDLNLIQIPGRFLEIARDERHSAAFIQKLDGCDQAFLEKHPVFVRCEK